MPMVDPDTIGYPTEPEGLGTLDMDPTSVPGLLGMCMSALDSLEREINMLTKKTEPMLRPDRESPLDSSEYHSPEFNSSFGEQLSALYDRIVHVDRKLTNVRLRLDV